MLFFVQYAGENCGIRQGTKIKCGNGEKRRKI
jgi:hypothetical protein